MNNAYPEKLLRSIHTFLARWHGADGELWDLTFSHKTLHVLLRGTSINENLVLACIDPQKIHSPVRWKNNQLHVDVCKLDDGKDGFILTDRNAGLEIVCGGVEVAEHVKLVKEV